MNLRTAFQWWLSRKDSKKSCFFCNDDAVVPFKFVFPFFSIQVPHTETKCFRFETFDDDINYHIWTQHQFVFLSFSAFIRKRYKCNSLRLGRISPYFLLVLEFSGELDQVDVNRSDMSNAISSIQSAIYFIPW